MDGAVPNKAQAVTAIQAGPPKPVASAPPPLPPPPPAPSSVLLQACPPQSQWVVVGLLFAAAALLTVNSIAFLPLGARPADLESGELLTCRLDLNQASTSELMQLPGIGPTLAERIVEHRHAHGKFQSVADLDRVPGIGPATLKRLENWVYVEKQPDPPPAQANHFVAAKPAPVAANNPPKAPPLPGRKINLNTASETELQKLPRIGPVLSQRIIEERNLQPFQSIDDLNRIKGIGPKTLDNIRPYVTVGEPP